MTPWISNSLVVVGLLLALFALTQTVLKSRNATTRPEKLEAMGAFVPGLSGLLLMEAIWVDSSLLVILLCVVAGINLLIGRACYELALGTALQDRDD